MSHPDDMQLRAQRAGCKHRGQTRPDFAETPGPGQESVWDYPRPPATVPDTRLVEVRVGELLIARSESAIRILETASPPTFYLPGKDINMDLLQSASGHSFCEWKGEASYYDLKTADIYVKEVAWSYEKPYPEFTAVAGYLSFYPSRVECYVAGERVRPQAGGFYGGWVTDEIIGPFKGRPGASGW